MKAYFSAIFISTLVVAIFPSTLLAIGISATPATLSVRANQGREALARFTVSNPSKEVGLFEAYPEEFEEFITLVPSRFVLEAGERREVLVRARRRESGIIRTVIAIEAQPLGIEAYGIGGGVRLPFSLEVREGSRLLSAISFGGEEGVLAWLLLGALTVLFLLRRASLSTLKRFLPKRTL